MSPRYSRGDNQNYITNDRNDTEIKKGIFKKSWFFCKRRFFFGTLYLSLARKPKTLAWVKFPFLLRNPLGGTFFRFGFKFPFRHFSRFGFKFPFLLRNPLGGHFFRFGFIRCRKLHTTSASPFCKRQFFLELILFRFCLNLQKAVFLGIWDFSGVLGVVAPKGSGRQPL